MNINELRRSGDYVEFKAYDAHTRQECLKQVKFGVAFALIVFASICIGTLVISMFCFSSQYITWKLVGAALAVVALYAVVRVGVSLLPGFIEVLGSDDFKTMGLVLGKMVETKKIEMTPYVYKIISYALVEEDERNAAVAAEMISRAGTFVKAEMGPVIGKIRNFEIRDYIIVVNSHTGERKRLVFHGFHDTDPIGEFNKIANKGDATNKIGFVVQNEGDPSGIFYMEE